MKHQPGTVVWVAEVPDPRLQNPKDRHVVLIKEFDDEGEAGFLPSVQLELILDGVRENLG